ncbi:hypothetical protein B4168_0401 [Anoxybacillus flavithermus]|nr:hypothetical protein B4168_0401 [Anoxybacillus flavithermus]OAO87347.1 hypothetical protein GT23_1315 [Parageobacillus thermoglucosidasius]
MENGVVVSLLNEKVVTDNNNMIKFQKRRLSLSKRKGET